MAQWEAEENKRQLSYKAEETRWMLEKQYNTVEYYVNAAIKEADALQRHAIMSYKESDTGIAELTQSLKSAQDIRKAYIDALHQYNVLTIEMELYTDYCK